MNLTTARRGPAVAAAQGRNGRRTQRSDRAFELRRAGFERAFELALQAAGRTAPALVEAMAYSALSPGKRLRPMFALTACEAAGAPWRHGLPAAVAVECVHAFSLVHDDLPAMDDDDFRRGRPTTHRRFGEALAILAGDALLALAFEQVVQMRKHVGDGRVNEAVRILARASGAEWLVGGQALDLAAEGRRRTVDQVVEIYGAKTAGLRTAALSLGFLSGGMTPARVRRLRPIGIHLGIAFQIQDDLLNASSSLRKLGKRAGTDVARRKATLHRVAGEEQAHAVASYCLQQARRQAKSLGAGAAHLLALIDRVGSRDR